MDKNLHHRPGARRSIAGVSYLELLAAALILGIPVLGLIGVWQVCYLGIRTTGETNMAGQIARAELERVKVLGGGPAGSATSANFAYKSSASVSSSTTTWTVAYVYSAAGWTSGGTWTSAGTAYYD